MSENNERNTKKTANWSEYLRQYRADHPEKVQAFRVRAAVNLLTRLGYSVTAPANQEGK